MGRVILIILDGLGVGAMPDVNEVRPEDIGSNTLKHVLKKSKVNLPNLSKLGLGNILMEPEILLDQDAIASTGVCYLSHYGADSYAGHNEIMGSSPRKPIRKFMCDAAPIIEETLLLNGYCVTYPIEKTGVLEVNEKIIIADNMENDEGQIINVTGPLDEIDFSEIIAVGKLVRQVVKTSRVIALGGTSITKNEILNAIYNDGKRTGVNTPELQIYNEHYQVRHLGFGITPETQISSILQQHGYPVHLIGKMADVIDGNFDINDPVVSTAEVFQKVLKSMDDIKSGLISATIQETDLSGHEQDCEKFAEVLRMSDQWIGEVIHQLNEQDLLIISADHGNDPTIGHNGHTREMTPLIAYVKNNNDVKNLGVRNTLSDIAATIADYFNVPSPENGSSFLNLMTVTGTSR